ncbi:UNVERIFIED_CONTAM: hypothetical protein HDU68_001575 [Siphonaria sp. JEL0065]|nr:hypothetical protein HDU68_001575 [Siphonaria sp. JEL0065]
MQYTVAVKSAADSLAKCSGHAHYYMWLDYLCTDQTNLFEVREATFKMAFVYSAAAVTLVVLDESLDHTHPDFWKNRLWTMQEEALSRQLVFINRQVQVNESNDPSGDTIGTTHIKYVLPNWKESTDVQVAENQGPVQFREFWPKARHRFGGWDCDKVYATQYCSIIEPKLDIRYDLDYGLEYTRIFENPDDAAFKNWEVSGALGFIGGFGLLSDSAKLTDSQIQDRFLPTSPVLGLVVDATVTLAVLDITESNVTSDSLLLAIKHNSRGIQGVFNQLPLHAVASDLMSAYWKLIQTQCELAVNEIGYYEPTGSLICRLLSQICTPPSAFGNSKTPLMDTLKTCPPDTIEHALLLNLQECIAQESIEATTELLLKTIAKLSIATIWCEDDRRATQFLSDGVKQGKYSILFNSRGLWVTRNSPANVVDDAPFIKTASCNTILESTPFNTREQVFTALNAVLEKKGRGGKFWSGLEGLGRRSVFVNEQENGESGYYSAELVQVGLFQGLLRVDEYRVETFSMIYNVFSVGNGGDDSDDTLGKDLFGAWLKEVGWSVVRGAHGGFKDGLVSR